VSFKGVGSTVQRETPKPPPGKPNVARENIASQLPDGRWNTYNGQIANARFNSLGQRILPGGEGGARFIPPDEYKEFLQLGHGGIFDVDLDNIDVAPWRKRGIDADAYFNYGFNERTWRRYINEIRRARMELHLRHTIETASGDHNYGDSDLPVEVRRALGGWEYGADRDTLSLCANTGGTVRSEQVAGVSTSAFCSNLSHLREHPKYSQQNNPEVCTKDRDLVEESSSKYLTRAVAPHTQSGTQVDQISHLNTLNDLRTLAQKIQEEYLSLRGSNELTPSKNYELQQKMLHVKTEIAALQRH